MKLPTKVYIVERVPPETEDIPYYGRRLVRLYQTRAHAESFVQAHTGSKYVRDSEFRIYETEAHWVEVPVGDVG